MRPARRPGRQGRRDERPSRGTVVPDPSAPSRSLNESFRSIPLDPPPTAASSASATSAWIETERSKVIMGGAKAPAGLCCGDGEGRNRTGDTTVFSRVLYQLSYLARGGKFSRELERGSRGGEAGDQDVHELALHQGGVGSRPGHGGGGGRGPPPPPGGPPHTPGGAPPPGGGGGAPPA